MPLPRHCHECDKPTRNGSGLCAEHRYIADEMDEAELIEEVKGRMSPKHEPRSLNSRIRQEPI